MISLLKTFGSFSTKPYIILAVVTLASAIWWKSVSMIEVYEARLVLVGELQERKIWQDKYAAVVEETAQKLVALRSAHVEQTRNSTNNAQKRAALAAAESITLRGRLKNAETAAKGSDCKHLGIDYLRMRKQTQCKLNTVYTKYTGVPTAGCGP